MTRNIVLCLGGTSNQYAATNTNVVKLYAMLDHARNDQIAYYQLGIGAFPPPGVWKQRFMTRLDFAVMWPRVNAAPSSGVSSKPKPAA